MTGKLLVIDDQAGINAAVMRVATDLGLQAMAIREPLKATDAFISFAPDLGTARHDHAREGWHRAAG